MNTSQINLDDFVDYEKEYRLAIKDPKVNGNQLIGRCPFHDDRNDSFSANLKTGMCKCFAGCIEGNFITFWGMKYGIDNKSAYKEILGQYGKLEDKPKKEKPKLTSYTISEYSLQKRLPEDFLTYDCRAYNGKDRDGTKFLKLPYCNEGGDVVCFRKRYGNKEFRWSQGSKGKLILYGLWRLPEFRSDGYVILVEGESDTQTLWHLGFPALGVPGASVFNENMVNALMDFKVYIHKEPDKGGETFLEKTCRGLKDNDFEGEVYVFSCSQFGQKDPSDLYLNETDAAKDKLERAVEGAEQINLDKVDELIPETIKDAPLTLRQPQEWIMSDKGISHRDPKP